MVRYLVLVFLLCPRAARAHESWVLTPEQMVQWSAKPLPEIFTQFNATNVSLVVITALFLVGWILLNYTGARELFPDLQVRLASYGGYTSLALRIALFVMLEMAAFGLGPRHGVALFETPTLLAPDLELRPFGAASPVIAVVEGIIGLSLLFGIYVRAAAAGLLMLCFAGLALFGASMLGYIGLVGGAAVYLLLQGAGAYSLPLPAVPVTGRIEAWLARQPRERAQWLLRMLAGLNLVYLGLQYKFLQPNLMIGIVELHQVPTFGLDSATFVFGMALIETLSGLLIMAGVLMRPLAVILFIGFVFFSVILAASESILSHSIYFGLLVSFITNSAGRWRRPVASDRPARVVILGASAAGIHCAMRLERLLGEFTNVHVTLVHRESYFLFQPLLPEVVGGTVQPGNIVNPIRRLCPRTRFIQGEAVTIDPGTKEIQVTLLAGETLTVCYDQLVIAPDSEASLTGIPGFIEHALPIATIGDGLFLRQQVLERMEEAGLVADPDRRRALLTFSVVGGGLRGAATAAEIRALINSALPSYPTIAPSEPRVMLFEERDGLLPGFDPETGAAARRRLERVGVEVLTGTSVAAMTPQEVVLRSGVRIPCRTVVGALVDRPRVVSTLPRARSDGRLAVDEFLRAEGMDGITVAGDCAALREPTPPLIRRDINMGRMAAYNILAALRGYSPFPWPRKKPLVYVAAMGRSVTVGYCLGLRFGGIPAWVLSRLSCLLTLPGLERNVRVLLDWMLDIPFRNDIVVLAPQRTPKLGRAHYEAGDEIIRQGEKGECAYLLLAGEVEVLTWADGRSVRVATLKAGECFGEIALLSNTLRTKTVKCLTPVDVVAIHRDHLMLLTEGYRELGGALKAGMNERI